MLRSAPELRAASAAVTVWVSAFATTPSTPAPSTGLRVAREFRAEPVLRTIRAIRSQPRTRSRSAASTCGRVHRPDATTKATRLRRVAHAECSFQALCAALNPTYEGSTPYVRTYQSCTCCAAGYKPYLR